MERIAKFEKVSYDQFLDDTLFCGAGGLNVEMVDTAHNRIKLPTRATTGSAGYDFYSPYDFTLEPGEDIVIPTGIRSYIDEGWLLMCVPKSGLSFKFYVRLANTMGIIDSDYYYSDNEGHILMKIRNEGHRTFNMRNGEKFFQGIFLPFGITKDDNATERRNGGMGSTGK